MAAGELFAFREWDNYSWTSGALCHGMSEIFFPPAAERPQARERREAQARVRAEALVEWGTRMAGRGILARGGGAATR